MSQNNMAVVDKNLPVLMPTRHMMATFDYSTNKLTLEVCGNFDGYVNLNFKRQDWYFRGLRYSLQAWRQESQRGWSFLGPQGPPHCQSYQMGYYIVREPDLVWLHRIEQTFINPKQPMPIPETIHIVTADSDEFGLEVQVKFIGQDGKAEDKGIRIDDKDFADKVKEAEAMQVGDTGTRVCTTISGADV